MQKNWTSVFDTDWRRGAQSRQQQEEQEEWFTPSTYSSSQSTMDSPMPALPSRSLYQLHYQLHTTPRTSSTTTSIPARDQQELAHLLEHWHSDGIKFSVAMSIPILVSHVFDDDVFLKLPVLSALPDQSPKIEAFLREENVPAHQPASPDHKEACELNALQKYWMFICRYFCRRMKLSTTAFVLGIIFVHQYRVSTATLTGHKRKEKDISSIVEGWARKPPVIYSANHLFLVAMMLSNKYTEDHPYPNSYWSSHFGIQVGQLNRLEQSFLQHLDHTIFIRKDEFNRWVLCLSRLCKWLPMASRRQGGLASGPLRRNSREDYPAFSAGPSKFAALEPDCGLGELPPGLGLQPRHHQQDERRGWLL